MLHSDSCLPKVTEKFVVWLVLQPEVQRNRWGGSRTESVLLNGSALCLLDLRFAILSQVLILIDGRQSCPWRSGESFMCSKGVTAPESVLSYPGVSLACFGCDMGVLERHPRRCNAARVRL